MKEAILLINEQRCSDKMRDAYISILLNNGIPVDEIKIDLDDQKIFDLRIDFEKYSDLF